MLCYEIGQANGLNVAEQKVLCIWEGIRYGKEFQNFGLQFSDFRNGKTLIYFAKSICGR